MEIKRTIISAPTTQTNETKESSFAPERTPGGITEFQDSWEQVNPENSYFQEMMKAPTVSAQQGGATPISAEQMELIKGLEQKRYFFGQPTMNLKPAQTGIVPTATQTTNVKHSAAILNLSQITQKSPAELEALFKKYGLDPGNLPTPPNRQVAKLFNDPAFDSTLNDLKTNVSSTYQNYNNEITNQTSKANSINASNMASDTSVPDDLNTAPFEYLYNAKNGANTAEGQAWVQSREMMGDRVAKLLSSMYPNADVKSNPSAGNWDQTAGPSTLPGFVEFDGQQFNAVPSSSTGEIYFGNEGVKVDYPQVQFVTWEYDSNGAGAVSVPDWMQKANYPTHDYDSSWNNN